MDRAELELRTYYEAEADRGLRPTHDGRRQRIAERFARALASSGCRSLLDVGSGPGAEHASFVDVGIRCIGVDLAVGNGFLADTNGRTVVPASLFRLPFADATFPAGWSMSTFQHIDDEQIDDALAEFVRVLRPDAPVVIGLWGGRDEVVDSPSSNTGIDLPRRFVLRSHDRIRSILGRHFVVESDETSAAGTSDWEYHVASCRTPT